MNETSHAPMVTCPRCGESVYEADSDRADWVCAACRVVHCFLPMRQYEHYADGSTYLICEACGAWRLMTAADALVPDPARNRRRVYALDPWRELR